MKHIMPLALLFALCMGCADEKLITVDYCPDDPNKTAPGKCGCGKPDIEVDGEIKCEDSKCDEGSLCDGNCVDLTKDPLHCGSCDNKCKDGESCINSKCESDCPSGNCEKCEKEGKPITCDEGMTCSNGECLCGGQSCADDEFCYNGQCTKCKDNATYNKEAKRCICNDDYVDMIEFTGDYDKSDKQKNYLCRLKTDYCQDHTMEPQGNNICACKKGNILVESDNGTFKKKCACDTEKHWIASGSMCICDSKNNWVEKGGSCQCRDGYIENTSTKTCDCKPENLDSKGNCKTDCPEHLVWNDELAKCACPEGQLPDGDDACKCDTANGYTPNLDADPTDYIHKCARCTEESTWDDENKTCVCNSKKKLWSDNDNKCICDESIGWITSGNTCACNQAAGWSFTEGQGDNALCECRAPRIIIDGLCSCDIDKGWIAVDNKCVCDPAKGLTNDGDTACKCDDTKGFKTDNNGACVCEKENFIVKDGTCQCDTESGFVSENDACKCPDHSIVADGKCICDADNGYSPDANNACICDPKFGLKDPSAQTPNACECNAELFFVLNENRTNENPEYCICTEDRYLRPSDDGGYTCAECKDGSKLNDAKNGCDCENGGVYDISSETCKDKEPEP